MKAEFAIGNRKETVDLRNTRLLAELRPGSAEGCPNERKILEEALSHPIGSKTLEEIIAPSDTVSIVTSDNTRPMPTDRVLPVLLEKLYAIGVKKENIELVFARGSHRHMTKEEQIALAGDAWNEIVCRDHDDTCVAHLGVTSRGTPVDIDAGIVHSNRIICLGNVEYHYFAGFSGGAKAIMPGCSTRDAIEKNHRFMVRPEACSGHLEGNPVREDLEEAAAMVHVDFILNVVLGTHKQILYAACGHMIEAHRDTCAYLASVYASKIEEKADIVIVSQGGTPKDRNLYQTQKALDNAGHAVKDGGTILLVGSCREGFGEAHFERYMTTYTSEQDVLDSIYEHFVLGGHKAAAIASLCRRAEVYLISDMDPDIVKKTFLKPCGSLQEAFDLAVERYGEHATVITMPYGGSTLPVLTGTVL